MFKGQMFHHACMELQECEKYCLDHGLCEKSDAVLEYTDPMVLIFFSIQIIILFSGEVPVALQCA